MVPGWFGYGLFGYADSYDSAYSGSGNTPVYGDESQDAYYEVAPDPALDYAEEPYTPSERRSPYEPGPAAIARAGGLSVVTLFYKDGRPEERIQSYALTRTKLFVLDGRSSREIALDDLDLPRTEQPNREAGVDFDVPVSVE